MVGSSVYELADKNGTAKINTENEFPKALRNEEMKIMMKKSIKSSGFSSLGGRRRKLSGRLLCNTGFQETQEMSRERVLALWNCSNWKLHIEWGNEKEIGGESDTAKESE